MVFQITRNKNFEFLLMNMNPGKIKRPGKATMLSRA